MATSRSLSRTRLLAIALLVLTAWSSITFAAKCYPKEQNTPTIPETGGTETETPTVDTQTDVTTTETPSTDSTTSQVASSGASLANEGLYPTDSTTQGSGAATPSSNGTARSSTASGDSAQTSTTSLSGHATFGDVTSASGACVVGNPNAFVTTEQLDWVWKNTLSKEAPNYDVWITDQLVKNKGKINYCVRWDSKTELPKATAAKFQGLLERQLNLWNHWLVGYECWPYESISVKVVGFAVKDKSILGWSDDSLGTIYEGELDDKGNPQCPPACFKQGESFDASSCKGTPYDMFLWPSDYVGEGIDGLGSYDGQQLLTQTFLDSMDDEEMLVLAHEMGHGFGLQDMYVEANKPAGFPACIMDASPTVTPADGWMLRRILENFKHRYNF